ncbi:MAG: hypothetical protein GX958_02760 [Desulfitobacterium sp.]|nr:hypothetical protein [Desulfitobacterium sp.]
MKKSSWILLFGVSSLILPIVAITGKTEILGVLIGYILSFILILWLIKDTLSNVDGEILVAVKRMRRGFFTRIALVTLVVVVVGYYFPDWLFPLAIGIALGLIVFLIDNIKGILQRGKG